MATRLTLHAVPRRVTAAPLTRRALPISTSSSLRQFASAGSASEVDKDAAARHKEDARRRAEERWIKQLKEEHGDGWRAIFEESRARAERNAEAVREQHRQARVGQAIQAKAAQAKAAEKKAEKAMKAAMKAAEKARLEKAKLEKAKLQEADLRKAATGATSKKNK